MNSWEIIKSQFIAGTNPGTMGRHSTINDAAELLVELREHLSDYAVAVEAMNCDEEVVRAFARRGVINELRQSGIM